MKTESENSTGGKIAGLVIVALVFAGTLLVSVVANVGEESGIMGRVFIFFVGAIIAIQLVPGMMLFGAMLKGIFARKAKVPAEDSER
jgi:hypothetical protein